MDNGRARALILSATEYHMPMLLKPHWMIVLLLALGVLLSGPVISGEEEAPSQVPPAVRAGINSALDYLASRVRPDGSVTSNYSGIATSALVGTAFLANGCAPNRGKYGPQLARITNYILSNSHETSGYISSRGGDNMYAHGFATLFLAEVYGMSPDPRIEIALRKAVKLIEYSQGEHGGWRYYPRPSESDISVTICQVMALRAARTAGIPVDPDTIKRATECVKQGSNPDGGFSYIVGQGRSSSFPRSAAGVCILYYLGEYEAPEVKRGIEYIDAHIPSSPNAQRSSSHIMYGYYYAAQAMFQVGGDYWNRWYPDLCAWVLRNQYSDGSLNSSLGGDYATAMAAIVMQIPYRYLPIFQR